MVERCSPTFQNQAECEEEEEVLPTSGGRVAKLLGTVFTVGLFLMRQFSGWVVCYEMIF